MNILKILSLCFISFFISVTYAKPKIELSESEKQFISQNPKILLGTEKSWEPYVILNEDGSVTGYDADILERINQLTGANFVLQAGNWRDMQDKAKRREIDGLSTGGIHDERKQYLNFSDVYITLAKMVLVAKGRDTGITHYADLKDKKIAVHRGNLVDEKLARQYPDSHILYFDTIEEMIQAVILGQADATFGNGSTLYLANKLGLPYLEIAFELDEKLNLAFGIRKDWPEAVSILNKGLAEISKLERVKLIDKWFLGTNFSARQSIENFTPLDWLSFAFIWKSLLVILVLGALFLLWNRKLARMNQVISNQLDVINDNLPIITLDPSGKIASVNSAFFQWFGQTADDDQKIIGQAFEAVFPIQDSLLQKVSTDSQEAIRESRFHAPPRYVMVKQLTSLDHDRPENTYVMHDITDRINALHYEYVQKATHQKISILGDMHDGFGGVITILSMTASNALTTDSIEEKNLLLKQIAKLSKEAATEMRLMMNALSHETVDWETLISDIRQVANALLENSMIKLDFEPPASLPDSELSEEQYLSIYRWFKECVVNVIKHSTASKLEVRFFLEGDLLHIILQDDGKGLNTEEINHGHGLSSMRKRADELDAVMSIESVNGTTIKLAMPLNHTEINQAEINQAALSKLTE